MVNVELALIFILGLTVGSFLNVLIDRLPNDKSILGRSYCDHCKKTLSWKDLIPVLSFVYLRGKCRYCHAPLSYQYPIVELLTGLLFIATYQFATLNFQLIYYLLIVSSLIVVFFADLKYGIIPDKILLPAIVVSLVYLTISTFYFPSSNVLHSISNHLLSAF